MGLLCFFGMTMMQTSLMQSGAFEVYVNDNLEYSKLKTGDMPTFNIMRDILAKYNVLI